MITIADALAMHKAGLEMFNKELWIGTDKQWDRAKVEKAKILALDNPKYTYFTEEAEDDRTISLPVVEVDEIEKDFKVKLTEKDIDELYNQLTK